MEPRNILEEDGLVARALKLSRGWAVALALLPIYFYQRCISPLLPPSCRFRPTCSQYAVEALKIHGFWRGSWLAARRLSRCHPFHPGGYDPVPKKPTGKK